MSLDLRPLPEAVQHLLASVDAPPRLVAHLTLVHDVARTLTDVLPTSLGLDPDAVHYGAATHDIGKVVHPAEISGPGHAHEPAGYDLLRARGVPDALARFARTHASWAGEGIGVDDLAVSLADTIWKGGRVEDLENLVVARLAAATGMPPWEAFLWLDDRLAGIAAAADERLAYQASFPVTS